MWEYAGIARTAKGLRKCIERLDEIVVAPPEGATEEANMADTARLIVEAALMRKESRGGTTDRLPSVQEEVDRPTHRVVAETEPVCCELELVAAALHPREALASRGVTASNQFQLTATSSFQTR